MENNNSNNKGNNKVLIIIVTCNSEKFIEKCLFSIANQNFKNYFLLVIDNNSSDSTVSTIKQYKNAESRISSSNFKLICMKKNLGFSGAVNYGVFNYFSKKNKLTSDDFKYLVLINPDMILDDDAINNLIFTFNLKRSDKTGKENSNTEDSINYISNYTGAAGGMILDYNSNEISHLGGKIKFNFITSHIKNNINADVEKIIKKENPGLTNEENLINADYVTGALFITEMNLFKKLGGFDTGYKPAYFEELDYCLKLKRLNLDIVVNPLAFAWHFEGASSGKFSANFYYYYHKNRIRCAIINSSFINILKIFFKSEVLWLKSEADKNQILPLVKAYLINWIFCPYYMIIKIKNFIKLKKIKKNLKIKF
jgi:GT2 family glycosyltransferase